MSGVVSRATMAPSAGSVATASAIASSSESVDRMQMVETLCQRTQSVVAERDHRGSGAPGLGDNGRGERIADRADQRLPGVAGVGDARQRMPSRGQLAVVQRGAGGLPCPCRALRVLHPVDPADRQIVGVEGARVDDDGVDTVEDAQRAGRMTSASCRSVRPRPGHRRMPHEWRGWVWGRRPIAAAAAVRRCGQQPERRRRARPAAPARSA